VLTSSPQTDIRTLSSSVNITLARDCPDLPVILPSDLDISTVPEISDNDEDEEFESSEIGTLTLAQGGKEGEVVRDPLAPMIEA
jgi:hypothetical protein